LPNREKVLRLHHVQQEPGLYIGVVNVAATPLPMFSNQSLTLVIPTKEESAFAGSVEAAC